MDRRYKVCLKNLNLYPNSLLAIVQLHKPVKMFRKTKGRICLPDDQNKPSDTQKCYLAGWGLLKKNPAHYTDKLRQMPLSLVPLKTCRRKLWLDKPSKNSQCARKTGRGKKHCVNDNGGSLVCNVDGKPSFVFINP